MTSFTDFMGLSSVHLNQKPPKTPTAISILTLFRDQTLLTAAHSTWNQICKLFEQLGRSFGENRQLTAAILHIALAQGAAGSQWTQQKSWFLLIPCL